MSYDPYKIIPAVLVAIIKEDKKVLLARRNNTSYMDGWYGLPGGHLEENETLQEGAVREVKEEVGLLIDPGELELFQIYQNQNTPGRQYIGFIFRAKKWAGRPEAGEDKVEGVEFFDMKKLPDKIIPYHKKAIENIKAPAMDIIFTPLGVFNPSGK